MIYKRAFSLALLGGVLSIPTLSQVRGEEPVVASSSIVSEKPLNDLFSRQWVKLGDAGQVDGQLVELLVDDKRPLHGLPVSLVREGKIIASATSDGQGKFSFTGVKPGLYSLVSRTNQTVAAFAVQVLEAKDATHLPSSIEVRAIRSAGEKVKDIVRAQLTPNFVSQQAPVVAKAVDPIADERRFANSHVIKLDDEGNLRGFLAKSGISATESKVEGMTIFVLKDGVEVARAEADASGAFVIKGLDQGVYGFVAAGLSGFVATSMQVVNPAIAQKGTDGTKLVAFNMQDCCPTMNCEVIESCEVTAREPMICETVVETPIVESCAPVSEVAIDDCGCGVAPSCGGGCGCGWGGGGWGGGGAGGGGGGLLGGGGFGNLIGLAGLAGIAAVIADDEDDGNVNLNQPPVQVSPIVVR